MTSTNPVHIHILIDRSGSMTSIAGDVIEGLNDFLDEQRAEEHPARVSIARFDSVQPFEEVFSGVPLTELTEVPNGFLEPRGATPLFDAVGRLIGTADADTTARDRAGLPAEDRIVAIITDGYENASVEFTGDAVGKLIEDHRTDGWVFVFIGADQDVYQGADAMRISRHNARNWEKSRKGTKDMFMDLSKTTSQYMKSSPSKRSRMSDRFITDEEDES